MNVIENIRREKIRKVLIVRFHSLGDIALSLPIIRAFRRKFPEARISYLCFPRYAEALRGVREVDEVIPMKGDAAGMIAAVRRLRKEKFDLVLDLLSSPGSGSITLLSGTALRIGMDTGRRNRCYRYLLPRGTAWTAGEAPRYTMDANREIAVMLGLEEGITGGGALRAGDRNHAIGFPPAETEESWAEDYLAGLGDPGAGFAGLVPGSKSRLKSWPEENFVRLAAMMMGEAGLRPLVLWGPGEEAAADRITAAAPGAVKAPPMGIARLGAVIGRLALLAGVDSGPKHLAVMQGIPTVTLFGPTDPRVWDPMTERHRVVYRDLPCSPCRGRRCAANVCVSKIEPREVIEEAGLALLHGPAPKGSRGMDGIPSCSGRKSPTRAATS